MKVIERNQKYVQIQATWTVSTLTSFLKYNALSEQEI